MGRNEITYIPLSQAAALEEISEDILLSTYYKKNKLNRHRFKKDEKGNILVALNYKYPLKDIMSEFYYKALIISKTSNNLCKEISISTGIKQDTLHHYFSRFTFKDADKATLVINALENYINSNSLFSTGELNYDD